jgi:hypothetical protein
MTTLTSPHDLLTAIPFLIGFKPTESIILISLRNDAVNLAMRIDYPDEISKLELANLSSHLLRNDSDAAIAVFYLPSSASPSNPVLQKISEQLSKLPIQTKEFLVVQNGKWRSLLCRDDLCCTPEGKEIPDIENSRIAAEQVALGRPLPFENISALNDSISALDSDEELLDLISKVPAIKYKTDPVPQQRQGAEAVIDFIADFSADGVCRDKKLIALVLVRLQDLQVRDFALGSVSVETLEIYFNAWRWLLRKAPLGFVAPAANLFAAVAYEKGEGALAHRSLDRAEADEPSYAMTQLLRKVFISGWSPASFSAMRTELHPRICDAIFSGNINS